MADPTLANYLGTTSQPLTLTLSANGPGWNAYAIGYQGIGNIPWSSDPASQWSSWNVTDGSGNYYGTITLNCDGTTATWGSYCANSSPYYLENIGFGPVPNETGAYQLTVGAIIQPTQSSPFPDAPPATPALHPGTNQPIVLSLSGTQIVDDQNNKVWLKGVVRPSLEWNQQGQYLSPTDIANMRAWGANVIRIPLNQSYWLASAPSTTIGSYRQIVDAMIYYAIQNNMAVILDLHWLSNGQVPMADADSITFWQQVATAYASFGTVLFELYNEANSITQQQWLSGGGGYTGYQQLYDAVRGVGANNLCIVGGLDYAYDLSFVSPSFCVQGTGVIYCSHPYDPKGDSDYTGEGGSLANDLAGVIGNFPLIFTEFGGNTDTTYDDTTYYNMIIDYANANAVHYTGFAWWVQSDPSFPTLISDWNGTPNYGGVIVHQDLQTNPGTAL